MCLARNDIFGAFDLVVIIPGMRTKFIQATLHTSPGMKKRPIDELPWNTEHSSFELWQKIPRKGSRIMVKTPSFEESWLDLGTIDLKDIKRQSERIVSDQVGGQRNRRANGKRNEWAPALCLADHCR
ncbi:MAG: hypothetical protein MZV49_24055 [Rhodopseudomonas palustris]|nr:hypothetical protein [Rhodopseudomonas palustris]